MKLIDADALKQKISDDTMLTRAEVLALIDAQPNINIDAFKRLSLFEIENCDPVKCRDALSKFLEYLYYAQPMK